MPRCPTMLLPSGWLLRHSVVMWLLFHCLVLMTLCFHHAATSCSKRCYCSDSEGSFGGKTMRCSNLHLTEIPQDIPNDTRRLYLDYNLLTIIPANAFNDLPLLAELDISHNELALLEPGALQGWQSLYNFWISRPTSSRHWTQMPLKVLEQDPTSLETPGTVTAGCRQALSTT